MSKERPHHKRILAIAPNSCGFGFAVLEGSERLIDWRVVQVREDKHQRALIRIATLREHYKPDVVVTEDPETSRRSKRVRMLLAAIRHKTILARIKWKGLSKDQVHKAFRGSGQITKYTVAHGISERFPELAPRLPPPRKPWMSEDSRMAIFQAVALALTLIYSSKRKAAKK